MTEELKRALLRLRRRAVEVQLRNELSDEELVDAMSTLSLEVNLSPNFREIRRTIEQAPFTSAPSPPSRARQDAFRPRRWSQEGVRSLPTSSQQTSRKAWAIIITGAVLTLAGFLWGAGVIAFLWESSP